MNRISMRNRLLIGIISTLLMLFVFIFPSELTGLWESEGLQGFVMVVIISVAAIQIAAISKVFKALAWIEALPLTLSVALIWTSLFVVDGTFQIAPGNYRYIAPSFLIFSVPMFMLITSSILAGIMLFAPAQDRKHRLFAQEKILGWKNKLSAKYSRRAIVTSIAAVLTVFLTVDLIVRSSLIASTNACIEEKFQQGWRSAYLSEPWQVSFTWSKEFVAGFEERGDWWASPTEPYQGPKDWNAFVKEVSVTGIPATLIKNGVRSSGHLIPMGFEATYRWSGFDFDAYVSALKAQCTQDITPPLFPISSDWEYGDSGVKSSIRDIQGYVAPIESSTP